MEKVEKVLEKTAESIEKTAESIEKTAKVIEKTAESIENTAKVLEKTAESIALIENVCGKIDLVLAEMSSVAPTKEGIEATIRFRDDLLALLRSFTTEPNCQVHNVARLLVTRKIEQINAKITFFSISFQMVAFFADIKAADGPANKKKTALRFYDFLMEPDSIAFLNDSPKVKQSLISNLNRFSASGDLTEEEANHYLRKLSA